MQKHVENFIDLQEKRYDKEAESYFMTHGDEISQKYRDRFIREKLFIFPLKGKKILDAMCAFGAETGFLLNQGALVEGLDISKQNAQLYEKVWNLNCQVSSIHKTDYPNNSFDIIYVCGGLHHVLPILKETICEIHRILKPGGVFCFVEPNASTFINFLRRLWYKLDRRFAPNEEAIDYKETLEPLLKIGFQPKILHFGGGIAYIFFAQSLIVKTPLWFKKHFYRVFFALEVFMFKIGLSPNLFFAGAWEKKK